MKTRLPFLLFLFLFGSCETEEPIATDEFRVVVESTSDLACGLPVIRFLDKAAELRSITNLETLTFNAYNLEAPLNELGAFLIIEVTQANDVDFRICNTLGVPLPGLTIEKARLAD